MIKAIETRYKGYRFRSRLEARWGATWAMRIALYAPTWVDGVHVMSVGLSTLDMWKVMIGIGAVIHLFRAATNAAMPIAKRD